MPKTAYRILTAEEFEQFQTEGCFEGSEKDRIAGFIHLSTLDQVPRTARKYRETYSDIHVVEVDIEAVERHVRWERGRDGDIYPHLFTPITRHIARPVDFYLSQET